MINITYKTQKKKLKIKLCSKWYGYIFLDVLYITYLINIIRNIDMVVNYIVKKYSRRIQFIKSLKLWHLSQLERSRMDQPSFCCSTKHELLQKKKSSI